jgi:predicted Ser/Thr protein kinase
MQTDARRRLKQVFADALARPREDRARFLAAVCDDQAMRVEVESLLASHDRAGDFLEQPGLSSAAPIALHLAAPRLHLESGRRLGPYEIQAPLGAGGMGEVYRALDTRLDRIVALKVLPRLAAQDVAARRRFEQEARAISKLSHPNICALYDIGRHDDIDFLVMEYLEGETLSKRLERGPLTPDQVVQSATEIAEALDRAHRHGVVHRDLKPSNIVLTESGAKLLDFGIAKLHAGHGISDEVTPGVERPHITQSSRIAGTVAYMSPEQLTGGPMDARSDLFSFGAVLFEMASGHRAFSRAPVDGVTEAMLHERSPRVTDLNPDVPGALADVIGKALEPDLDRRYQRASDIRADLRRARAVECRGVRRRAQVRMAGHAWTGTDARTGSHDGPGPPNHQRQSPDHVLGADTQARGLGCGRQERPAAGRCAGRVPAAVTGTATAAPLGTTGRAQIDPASTRSSASACPKGVSRPGTGSTVPLVLTHVVAGLNVDWSGLAGQSGRGRGEPRCRRAPLPGRCHDGLRALPPGSYAALCGRGYQIYMWVTGLGVLVPITFATSLRSLFSW